MLCVKLAVLYFNLSCIWPTSTQLLPRGFSHRAWCVFSVVGRLVGTAHKSRIANRFLELDAFYHLHLSTKKSTQGYTTHPTSESCGIDTRQTYKERLLTGDTSSHMQVYLSHGYQFSKSPVITQTWVNSKFKIADLQKYEVHLSASGPGL